MDEPSNEDVVRAYSGAVVKGDRVALERLRHPDWRAEWPQSGERVLGHANNMAILDFYPGGAPRVEEVRIVGAEDRWVVSAAQTVVRVVGTGDTWWGEWMMVYPDGSPWFCVALLELRDGRIYRERVYWAQPFDPPAWRESWVERTGQSTTPDAGR